MNPSPTVPFLDLSAINARFVGDFEAALRRVSARGQWVMGPELAAFEEEFAAYCGCRHAVGVGNGLDALELVLRAWDIGPGDEVVVPAETFVATWMAASLVGATPVAARCDPITHNIDPVALEEAISPRSRAVIAVHLYGRPADMDAVNEVARRHGLKVLEDAAQAHGARLGAVRAGALGDAAAFSFYPAKNLGALGDGGAITTSDDDLAHRLRALRNYGSTERYVHDHIGRNSRLDELQAAFLRAKLAKLDSDNAQRSEVAAAYLAAMEGLEALTIPPWAQRDEQSAWHLFVVEHPYRDALARMLEAQGIVTQVHYPRPPGEQRAYTDLAVKRQAVIRSGAGTLLSLPIGPTMSPQQVQQVIAAVRAACLTLAQAPPS